MQEELDAFEDWFLKIPKQKKDRLGGLFLLPKIGKIIWYEFSNFTNRITIISQTELQTEKHRQSTEFSKFPDKGKMQFNEQNYIQITSRNANRLQTERKKKRKRKERSKEKNKSKRKILKELNNIYII